MSRALIHAVSSVGNITTRTDPIPTLQTRTKRRGRLLDRRACRTMVTSTADSDGDVCWNEARGSFVVGAYAAGVNVVPHAHTDAKERSSAPEPSSRAAHKTRGKVSGCLSGVAMGKTPADHGSLSKYGCIQNLTTVVVAVESTHGDSNDFLVNPSNFGRKNRFLWFQLLIFATYST